MAASDNPMLKLASQNKSEPKEKRDFSDECVQQAARMIQEANAILVCTGAGMGVASGIGTFRGKNAGIWPPLEDLGIDFTEMSNPQWFSKPANERSQESANFGWSFWHFRYMGYTGVEPHQGYHLISKWCNAKRLGGFSFTSNIDGHWERCELGPNRVLECHGSVRYMQCSQGESARPACQVGPSSIWPVKDEYAQMRIDPKTQCALNPLPTCRNCGGPARPCVLMFGDWSWRDARCDAQEKRFTQWLQTVKADANAKLLVLEVGAGSAVPTVRNMTEQMGRKLDARIIRINPEESQIPKVGKGPHAHTHLPVPTWDSLAFLKAVDEALGTSIGTHPESSS